MEPRTAQTRLSVLEHGVYDDQPTSKVRLCVLEHGVYDDQPTSKVIVSSARARALTELPLIDCGLHTSDVLCCAVQQLLVILCYCCRQQYLQFLYALSKLIMSWSFRGR